MSNYKRYSNILKRKIFLLLFLNFSPLLVSSTFSYESEKQESELIVNSKDFYMLGPGDNLLISFYGLSVYDTSVTVSPTGIIKLPEIGRINIEGLTVPELENQLIKKYDEFIFEPKIDIHIAKYRPITVFIKGEVEKKGLYTFNSVSVGEKQRLNKPYLDSTGSINEVNRRNFESGETFPKLFDVIKNARGFTNYADISKIEVIRKNNNSNGGGLIKTDLDFIKFLRDGDQSQNLRIYDGDIINIPKSEKIIKEQILIATSTNISPDLISVYITGNVVKTGRTVLQRGSTLVEAIAASGGKKLLTGKIEFLRFNDEGDLTKRKFYFDQKAMPNSKLNPILRNGDIINVNKTLLGSTTTVLKEVTTPILSGIGLYKLFE